MPEPLVIPRVKLTYNLLTTLGHAWLELYFWSLAIFVLPNILNNWPRCFSFYPSLGAPAWQIAGGFELCRRIGSFFFIGFLVPPFLGLLGRFFSGQLTSLYFFSAHTSLPEGLNFCIYCTHLLSPYYFTGGWLLQCEFSPWIWVMVGAEWGVARIWVPSFGGGGLWRHTQIFIGFCDLNKSLFWGPIC